jgi:hypothetical protein
MRCHCNLLNLVKQQYSEYQESFLAIRRFIANQQDTIRSVKSDKEQV